MTQKSIYMITIGCFLSACAVPDGAENAAQPDTVASAAGASGQTKPKARPETISTNTPKPQRPPAKDAKTVEDFDTTTKAERTKAVEAAKSADGATLLGKTITSLGAPTEPGLWMKTPLVSKPGKGRVENPATGDSVVVDLLPLDGPKSAGSQLSLAAFRLINAPLTDLPELNVFRISG